VDWAIIKHQYVDLYINILMTINTKSTPHPFLQLIQAIVGRVMKGADTMQYVSFFKHRFNNLGLDHVLDGCNFDLHNRGAKKFSAW